MIEQISNRQLGWLVAAAVIGTVFLPITNIVAGVAGADGWLAIPIGYGASFILALLLIRLHQQHPGKNIVAIGELLLTKLGGRLLGLMLFLLFGYLTAMTARVLGVLYNTAVMPRTPVILFVVAMLILAAIVLREGLEVVARINDVLLIIIIGTIAIMLIIALPNIELDSFRPFFAEGPGPVLHASVFTLAIATEYVLLLGFLLPLVRPGGNLAFAVALGLFMGSSVLLSLVIASIGIFGPEEVLRFLYPAIQLATVLEIGDFVKGVEILLLGGWTAASLLEISLFFYASVVALANTLGFKDYRHLVVPLGSVFVAVALIPNNVINVLTELELLTNLFFLPFAFLTIGLLTFMNMVKGGDK